MWRPRWMRWRYGMRCMPQRPARAQGRRPGDAALARRRLNRLRAAAGRAHGQHSGSEHDEPTQVFRHRRHPRPRSASGRSVRISCCAWAAPPAACWLRESTGGRPKVLIGKDTRISGYMFESALEAGLVAAGADVRLLGPMPTPAVAFLTRSHAGAGGHRDQRLAQSAPRQRHQVLLRHWREAVRRDRAGDRARSSMRDFVTVPSERLGKAVRIDDAVARYVEFCKATVAEDFSLHGMKIVLDCAHGATYQVAPQGVRRAGRARSSTIGDQPDGFNINRDVGSTHPRGAAAGRAGAWRGHRHRLRRRRRPRAAGRPPRRAGRRRRHSLRAGPQLARAGPAARGRWSAR